MIGVQDTGPLWTLVLRRPEKANSLTKVMLETLERMVRRATIEGARALILTAEGKVFSAGADLDEIRSGLAIAPVWEGLSSAIADFPGLTIAALNGTLAGGAMGMVLACDIRLAVPGAVFFYPVMTLGILPQPSDPVRLARLIGPARAKLMLMGGARIDTDEALSWGLVDRIVAPEELMTAAQDLTAHCLVARSSHVSLIKRMIP